MKLSICEFTTIGASFAEDVAAYRAAGVQGIGICELKLTGDDDLGGLRATHCVPAVPSILPLPLMDGPADPEERIEAICASVRRFAAFDPVCVLFLTGPGDDRATVLDGIRRIAAEGERAGVRVALEPIQREFAEYWTIVSSIPETLSLLEEAGVPELPIMFDTWHLWNTPTLMDDIAAHAGRFAGVHVADWRRPTRNTNDRVFPGDGVAPLAEILAALARAGYDGWWDVEIFSDADFPDSLWKLEPAEAARRASESLERVLPT
jgi:sugar phosphate isomerase/epimerase